MKLRLTAVLGLLACIVSCAAGVKDYKAMVVSSYPHDTGAYTQGLFFHGDTLYESTGQYGESSFRMVNLETGKVLRNIAFSDKYFGEGSCMLGGKLYILTWTNKVAFVYDAATLKYERTWSYPREGWGLTTDGSKLYASDGSNRIYVLTPDFKLERTIYVKLEGAPLRYLNELEWVDGKIWANVYTTDMIVVIDPKDGKVESRIDCSALWPHKLRTPDADVLNGIAVNSKGEIFLTGKNWPRLYKVRLEKI
ncbi:MAG: glutaminyl-peptide cyclotransferase [Bacteroidales bacterium]|nr:glutaminyl-peptide cyclotransferase [Bacteroidales bacterium]